MENLNDICKQLKGTAEPIIIDGTEFPVISLSTPDYLEALEMSPNSLPELTDDEKIELKDTGRMPRTVMLRLSPEDNGMLFKQQVFVTLKILQKINPEFDTALFDAQLVNKLTPLFNAVMKISGASEELKKNPDSHN